MAAPSFEVDYRRSVLTTDLNPGTELGRLVLATGAIVLKPEPDSPFKAVANGLALNDVSSKKLKLSTDVPDTPAQAIEKHAKTLENFVKMIVSPAPPDDQWFPKAADGTFKFQRHRDVVDCTAFVVGDHLIATTAHSIFGAGTIQRKNLKDWYFVLSLTTEQVDVDNRTIVPAERIYELDRILYGKNSGLNDNVIGSDTQDWVLLSLKRKNLPFPAPLNFRDNGVSLHSIAGDKNVVSVGHAWNQSMKLVDAQKAQPENRGRIYTNGTPPAATDGLLKFSFLHNLLVQPGHSGSPVMLQEENGSYQLIGIQGSTKGLDPSNELGKKGLTWDQKPVLKQPSINLIPPAKQNEPTRFCIATRTEVWQHLIQTDPTHTVVKIYYKSRATGDDGSLDLYLHVLSLDGNSISTRLLKRGIPTSRTEPLKDVVAIPYAVLQPENIPPAHIVGATTVWTPTGATAFNPGPDVNARDATQNAVYPPVGGPKDSRILEELGVIVGKLFPVGQQTDFRDVARTTLLYKKFTAPLNAALQPEVLQIPFSYQLSGRDSADMDVVLAGFPQS